MHPLESGSLAVHISCSAAFPEREASVDNFDKKTPSFVTAHIFDPKTGYSKPPWTVGEHVSHGTAEKFCEDGNIYVIIYYEANTPNQMIRKRKEWNQFKAHFDRGDDASQA